MNQIQLYILFFLGRKNYVHVYLDENHLYHSVGSYICAINRNNTLYVAADWLDVITLY